MALSEEGEIDAALKKYREALALDFSWATTHYNIGLIHKYRSEWEESFRYNKRAVELDPDDDASNWNLAIVINGITLEWRLLKQKCRVGKRILCNPPGVAQQHGTFFNECLPAHPVDYGTHGVPYPPCIEGGTA